MTDDVIKSLQRIVDELSEKMDNLEKLIEIRDIEVQKIFHEGRRAIEELKTLVQGNDGLRVKGVVVRLEEVEDAVATIEKDRRSERDKMDGMYKGIRITLIVLSVANLGTLGAMLSQLFA